MLVKRGAKASGFIVKLGLERLRTRREGEPGDCDPFFLDAEVEEVEEAGEEKNAFGDPWGIGSSSSSSTSRTSRRGARDCFRGEGFLGGGRGRGMTLWLEAKSGVRLRSLRLGVTRPTTSASSTSSNPSAAPRGLTGFPFVLVVGRSDPKTPCFFVGVTKFLGTPRPSGGGEAGRIIGRAEFEVFCLLAEGRALLSVRPAGSSPAVGGESGRNRFLAAARCASWDSGVVNPSGGILFGPALSGEKGGRSSNEMDGSSGAPGCFLGVEVIACENDERIGT